MSNVPPPPPPPGGYEPPPPSGESFPPPPPAPPPPPPPSGGYPPPPPPPPPGGGYQQPGYGPPGGGYQQPYQQYPQPGAWMGPPLATWDKRLLSGLIDYFVPWLIAGIFFRVNFALGALFWLITLAWILYQQYQAGVTGQSIGKKTIGLRLLGESTGQPIGGGLGIGRYFLHILDGLPCYLGYLWPIWDAKRQTFADKILHTVVVVA